jgi:small-conductance mechanosensitive channel
MDISLTKSAENCQLLTEKIQKLEKINHNLRQDLKLRDIHFNNLKMINIKLTNTIKNLQSYREYVKQLILKRNRASFRIKRLIMVIKNMQNIIKRKNIIIKKINEDNSKLILQTGSFIKDNYIV